MKLVLNVATPVAFFGVIALWLGWMDYRMAIAVAIGLGIALALAGILSNRVRNPDSVGPIALGSGLVAGALVALVLFRDVLLK
jgi:hypothetical protein